MTLSQPIAVTLLSKMLLVTLIELVKVGNKGSLTAAFPRVRMYE
jgi:hypothetical protein